MSYHLGDSHILKISRSTKLPVKIKNVSLILQQKATRPLRPAQHKDGSRLSPDATPSPSKRCDRRTRQHSEPQPPTALVWLLWAPLREGPGAVRGGNAAHLQTGEFQLGPGGMGEGSSLSFSSSVRIQEPGEASSAVRVMHPVLASSPAEVSVW